MDFLTLLPGAIKVYREPLITGMKDKDGNPVHAVQIEKDGPVYMCPEYFDKLTIEMESMVKE